MLIKSSLDTSRHFRAMLHFPLLLLSVLLLLSNVAHAEKKLRVVTTFTIIQDIAQNVAGDAAVVESITKSRAKPGADLCVWIIR